MIVSKMLKENWRIKKIQNRQIEVEGEGIQSKNEI